MIKPVHGVADQHLGSVGNVLRYRYTGWPSDWVTRNLPAMMSGSRIGP